MMMRVSRCLFLMLLVGLLVNTMGCGRYMTNRYYDWRDTFGVGAGISSENNITGIYPPALGLYLEATDFCHLGAMFHYGYVAELDMRGSGVYHEDRARLGFGPWQALHLDQDYQFSTYRNYFKTPNTLWEQRMKSILSSHCGVPAKDLTYTHWAQDMQCGWFLRHRGYQYWEYMGGEFAIGDPFLTHLGVYLRLGIDISECSDFLLGWFNIDFKHDDLNQAMFDEKIGHQAVVMKEEAVIETPAAGPAGPSQDELDRLKAENDRLARELAAVKGKLKEQDGGIEIELPESVLFDTGRATLRPEGKQLLDAVAAKIKKQYANHKVTVEGHTDSRPVVVNKGIYKSNWELGAARALAVLHYLNDVAGLPKAYAATTYADNKPVANDSTPEGRQRNRRAVVVLRATK